MTNHLIRYEDFCEEHHYTLPCPVCFPTASGYGSAPCEPGPTITVDPDGTWVADGKPLCKPAAFLAQPDEERDG